MTVNSILEFQLLKLDDFSLTNADILKVGIYFIIAKAILYLLKKLIHKNRNNQSIDIGRREALYQISKYFIWTITIVSSFNAIGLDLTVLVASSAALFIGLGLGIQKIFKDFVSGIILLFEGSIEVDDVVEVDGMIGKVTKVGFRTTEIIDRNDINIIVPNSKFVDESVVNWSHNFDKTRFMVKVDVAYGSDADLVENVLAEAASAHPKVSKTDKSFARFKKFGDSSLNFELFFWTEDIFRVDQTKSEIRKNVYKLFLEKGIKIPFPQRDIHIIKDENN